MAVMDIIPLEQLGLKQRVDEVDEQSRDHEARERIIEDHDGFPLQQVAGIDVADRQREKSEADGEHDDVHHGWLQAYKCGYLPAGCLKRNGGP
jgi:hypothetical protein